MAAEPTRDESEGPAVPALAQPRNKEPDEEGPAVASLPAQASDKKQDEAEAAAVVATPPAKANDEIQDEEEGAAVATPPPPHARGQQPPIDIIYDEDCPGSDFSSGSPTSPHDMPKKFHHLHDMQYTDHVIKLWLEICRTTKLCPSVIASSIDPAARGQWTKFPTCNMLPMCTTPSSHFQTTTVSITDCHRRVISPESDGTFVVYHMVPLVHLVSPHPKAPGSSGILVDAGMRNGSLHGDGVGVYTYASAPHELFNPGDGWCMVEIKCRPFLTRVNGGSRGRYVLKSDQRPGSVGSLCRDCEVTAVLLMCSTISDFLKF